MPKRLRYEGKPRRKLSEIPPKEIWGRYEGKPKVKSPKDERQGAYISEALRKVRLQAQMKEMFRKKLSEQKLKEEAEKMLRKRLQEQKVAKKRRRTKP